MIKNKHLFIILFILVFGTLRPVLAEGEQLFVGAWKTADRWQSEYYIEVKSDGTATAFYGDDWQGRWNQKDGGVEIVWANGRRDFLFSGVMGRQRLHTPPPQLGSSGYSAGLTKVDAIPIED